MIVDAYQVIEEFLEPMQIERTVQTGYINVPLTNMLVSHGEVVFLTESKFNPFEENDKVKLVNGHYSRYAYTFKDKHGRLDACVFGHTKSLSDVREVLCAWTPLIRKNGFIILLNNADEGAQRVVEEYTKQIDPDYFEITQCADITFVRIK